ncbi:MAG TPA: hypothetical protein VH702_00325 [Vicinamibacterales bacterium]|jgi:hypothetical protein
MVWFCPERETFLMLTVGSSEHGGFAVVRVSKNEAVVLECFQRSEDAIARLNELEGDVRKGWLAA